MYYVRGKGGDEENNIAKAMTMSAGSLRSERDADHVLSTFLA